MEKPNKKAGGKFIRGAANEMAAGLMNISPSSCYRREKL